MFLKYFSLKDAFAFAMSLVYISLGFYILAAESILTFTSGQKTGIALILIVYGAVRFYAALKKRRERKTEEDDEED